MKYEYDTERYLKQISNSNAYFNTFLSRSTLAAGILSLDPDEVDTQEPHDSDEMYYILNGNGFLRINKTDYSVKSGKAFFVPKNTEHYFFGNTNAAKFLLTSQINGRPTAKPNYLAGRNNFYQCRLSGF